MANQIEKLNNIAITSIEKLNGLTDAQMEKVNGLEFAGLTQGAVFRTSSATLSTARSRLGGFGGSSDEMVFCGGNNTSATKLTSTETYDRGTTGGSIGSGGNLNQARFALTAAGTEAAGLCCGGTTASGEAKNSEEYNSNVWSNQAATNTSGGEFAALAGVQGSAMINGGYVGGYNAESESYNGSTWVTDPPNLGSNQAHGSASASSADYYRICGGYAGDDGTYNSSYLYTSDSWASSVDMTRTRYVGTLLGTPDDLVFHSGSGTLTTSDIFDGGSWANGPAPAAGRYSGNNSADCGGTNNSVSAGGGTGSANSTGTNYISHLDAS